MDYSPSQKKVYIKTLDAPSTFEKDESLPRLPVPTLAETLDKYLVSLQPFLTQQELEHTSRLCRNFRESPQGQLLQRLLLERSQARGNWLEEWWLRKGYLQFREPLIPFLNIGNFYKLIFFYRKKLACSFSWAFCGQQSQWSLAGGSRDSHGKCLHVHLSTNAILEMFASRPAEGRLFQKRPAIEHAPIPTLVQFRPDSSP